jgi:hypothetical protein
MASMPVRFPKPRTKTEKVVRVLFQEIFPESLVSIHVYDIMDAMEQAYELGKQANTEVGKKARRTMARRRRYVSGTRGGYLQGGRGFSLRTVVAERTCSPKSEAWFKEHFPVLYELVPVEELKKSEVGDGTG